MTSKPPQVADVGNHWFTNTHWTVVLTAGNASSALADAALESLCRAYWQPLYSFVRRRGYAVHDAQDLTQEFFARLLSRNFLSAVDRNKGKFRSFLLAALEHFLANDWRRSQAQKRGGGHSFISWEDGAIEEQYLHSDGPDLPAERSFERQWAITLLEQVVDRLRNEFVAAGKAVLFEKLKVFLTGNNYAGGYAQLATELKMTQAAVKMTVSRMRRRYAELLRAEIANTVSEPGEVEEELRALFAALN